MVYICLSLVVFAGIVCLYHIVLGVVACLSRYSDWQAARDAIVPSRFVVLIPAHNEETVIEGTLRSCLALDYDTSSFEIVVIADNCTDRTAEVVRSLGCSCWERHDLTKRGKGFALEWAFPKILAADFDVVVVLDADCTISPHALRVFQHYISRGELVLQANNMVSNPDDSPLSYLLAVANTIENLLFYWPKSLLGLCVMLRGTGMVLSCSILRQFPWKTDTSVEDTEYSRRLVDHGVNIQFVPEACVASRFPVDREELTVQRERWIGGGNQMACQFGFRLMAAGLLRRSLRVFDAGWTMFVTSRPFVILQLALTIVCCVLLYFVPGKGPIALALLGVCGTYVGAYLWYVALGIRRLGVSMTRIRLLAGTPYLLLQYLALSVRMLFVRGATWRARPRTSNQA